MNLRDKFLFNSRGYEWVFVVPVLALVLIHIWIVFVYGVNIPDWDDYDAILRFTMDFSRMDGITEKIKLILSPHNEHRIALVRFLSIICYYFFGELNFKYLIAVGNIIFLANFALIYLIFRDSIKGSFFYFLPIPFLFFNLVSGENFTWAMASIQNLGVLFFAQLSIYLALKKTKRPWTNVLFSLLSAVIALYCSGNGFVVFLVLVGGLGIIEGRFRQKITWLVFTAVILLIFFNDRQNSGVDLTLLYTSTALYSYLFTLVGSFFLFDNGAFPFYFGIIIFSLTGLLAIVGYYKRNSSVFFILIFLLGSCVVVALARHHFGVSQALSARYRIYSILLIIYLYLASLEVMERLNPKYLSVLSAGIVIAVSILYCSSMNYYLNYLSDKKNRLIYGAFRSQHNDFSLLSYPEFNSAWSSLEEASIGGFYDIPKISVKEIEAMDQKVSLPPESNNLQLSFGFTHNDSILYVNNGWAFVKGRHTAYNKIYLVLQSQNDTYTFKTLMMLRPDVTMAFNSYNVDRSGFSFLKDIKEISNGFYKVGLLITDSPNLLWGRTTKSLQFSGVYLEILDGNYQAGSFESIMPHSQYYFDLFETKFNSLSVRGWLFIGGVDCREAKVNIILQSSADTFVISAETENREDVSAFYGVEIKQTGFSVIERPLAIRPGNYDVAIQAVTEDTTLLVKTFHKLKIE